VAIRPETLRLARDLRVTVAATVDAHTRALVTAWARAWDTLSAEMDRAVADLITLGAGGWPARAQIGRADRAQSALAAAYSALQRLADTAGVTVAGDVPDVVATASKAQAALIASQLPPEAGTRAGLRARFDGRVPPNDLAWIVARTTEQITSRMLPLAPAAYEAMQRALILGVAVGDNPRTAAARMVSGLERQFNGGLTRALVVSRTEILDAHRAAAAVAQQANADVLAGWVWHAELDSRCCPSCWSHHGEMHRLDEPGPNDHQQGRCSRTPVTRSWRDLGFDVYEPPSVLPDAQTRFKELTAVQQQAVMGPARLAGLRDGSISWADLSVRRSTDGWRDSYGVRPVRDLLTSA
jgi:SPP1 gp7 family putative phage head morphogenesis protein